MVNRMRVLDEAWDHIGCHYVWSAGGANPGQADGMPGRPARIEMLPNVLDEGSPQLAVFAAKATHPNGKMYVCAGRYNAEGVRDSAGSRDLGPYLAGLRKLGASGLETYPRFSNTPRRIPEIKGVVWGEDCRGVRHFDCIGFINYCLSRALQRSIKYSTSQIVAYGIDQETEAKTYKNARPVSKLAPATADLVTRGGTEEAPGPIGFYDGEGGFVVHACDMANGVIFEEYDSSKREGCYRFGGGFFRLGH